MAANLPQISYSSLCAQFTGRASKRTLAPNTHAICRRDADGSPVFEVVFYGSTIATLTRDATTLCACGWPTLSTMRRLRAIVPVGVYAYIKDGRAYVGGADTTPVDITNQTYTLNVFNS